jgi:hypothetical protein
MQNNEQRALAFALSLDEDDFSKAEEFLSEDCVYLSGNKKLVGPQAICGLYEQNMLHGREKFDNLEWGTSEIEQISNSEFYIHFTDHIFHKGFAHTYKCKQKVRFDAGGNINLIVHMPDEGEERRLKEFCKDVGLT